ncbi:rhamnogalacturonan acetylesterase [Alkalitalea saponilacus]|nr:rhamnogalacturonan acetylesterase [Alkalitalea saponilacus]
MNLPEGNYLITIYSGHPHLKSSLTVKAESRRWMLEDIVTQPGEIAENSFVVNVRTPYISDMDSIRRKPREYDYLNWDKKLTLEFTGINPSVYGLKIKPQNDITTMFLAGNSTVVDQEYEPYASWGQMITRYFDQNVVVANYAESGESLSSFKSAGRLKKILSEMNSGDYLFIEFGHNDQKQSGEGVGPWTSFTDLLKEFIEETRNIGGNPVLVTPMHRRVFDENGGVVATHDDYPDAMRVVAKTENVPLIDLNLMSKSVYEAWGSNESKKAFVHYPAGTFPGQQNDLRDNTHFNNYGAWIMALCIIKGMRESTPLLAQFLAADAPMIDTNAPFPYSNWTMPHSFRTTAEKPDGN